MNSRSLNSPSKALLRKWGGELAARRADSKVRFSRWCVVATGLFVAFVHLAAAETPVPNGVASSESGTSGAASVIRIKAGVKKPVTDVEGNVWLPDQGFTGGVIADRDVITTVSNTTSPALYRSERYGVTSFSRSVPNGKYLVRIHFAEMYPRITGPGQRIFTFEVEGHSYPDFDIWALAGGPRRAYVVSTHVEVKDGKLDITFTPRIQYTTINGVEIVPETGSFGGT
jgi:Malectin domain